MQQSQTYEIAGPVRLHVENPCGDVRITTSPSGRAEVEVTALRDDEGSIEAVEKTVIDLRGNDLTVEVPRRHGTFFGRDPKVRVAVRVPVDSALRFATASADVSAVGTYAEVRGKTASGDVTVEHATEVQLETASGDLRVDDVRGEAGLRAASGDIRIGHVGGPLRASVVSGDLRVEAADNGAHVEAVSGDIEVRSLAAGGVEVKTVSGDVTLGVPQGTRVKVDVSTVSGDLTSDVELGDSPAAGGDEGPLVEITGRTVSGDLRVRRA
jgi:DUF4097 and DUF4098 domain-containing protein YvlB